MLQEPQCGVEGEQELSHPKTSECGVQTDTPGEHFKGEPSEFSSTVSCDGNASTQCTHYDVKTREAGTNTVNVSHIEIQGFCGFDTVASHEDKDEAMKDLTGVSFACFVIPLRTLLGVRAL